MEHKVFKNKKCSKPLPKGYKHKYCGACRNQYAQKVKNGFKATAGVVGTVACVTVTVVTAGKIINLKK